MPIAAEAVVRVRGGSDARKTIEGVSKSLDRSAKESVRAERTKEQAARRTAREQEVAARRAATTAQREAAKAAAAVKEAEKSKEQSAIKAAKEMERAARKAADGATRAAEKAARDQERISARSVRQAQRDAVKKTRAEERAGEEAMRTRSKRIGFATSAVAGVIAGGASALGTARGIAGIKSADDRIGSANDFQNRLIIAGSQAGVSDKRLGEIQSMILSASQRTGMDAGGLLGGVELGQKAFNDFDGFASNIEAIAIASRASGSEIEDLVGAMGYVKQAFGLTSSEAVDALNLMVAASAKGSIELKDFARDFAPAAGIFASNTGMRGMGGVRQFVAVAQSGGRLGAGSSETATMLERFVADLNDIEVLKGLKGIGVNTKGKTPQQIIADLAGNKKFANAGKRQKIFKERNSLKMVEQLMQSQRDTQSGRDGAFDIGTIAGLSASEGEALTNQTFGKISGTGGFKLSQQAADMQVDTIKNLETYNTQLIKVNDAGNVLEKNFRSLALWSGAIAATGATAAGVGLLQRLGGGGGAAGAAGGAIAAAGGAGGLGGLTGSIGTATRALGIFGTALGTFSAAYGLTTALGGDKLGEGIGNALYNTVHGNNDAENWRTPKNYDVSKVVAPASNVPSDVVPAAQQGFTPGDLQKLIRNTEPLRAIDASLKANLNRPGVNNDARSPK